MFSFFSKAIKNLSGDNIPPLNLPIHLIWIGSPLRQKDIKKLNQWNKLNPNNTVTVWVEPAFKVKVTDQLKTTKTRLGDLSTLSIPAPVIELIRKLMDPRKDELPPNPGAASDIYRFYILNAWGGWYFDVDKKPIKVNAKKIDPTYQFLLSGYVSYFLNTPFPRTMPDVIATLQNSVFNKTTIPTVEALVSLLSQEETIQLLRSKIASVRKRATESTTGKIAHACLEVIRINGKPIISYDPDQKTIPDLKLFNAIISRFDHTFENSWIKMPGIILDEDYLKRRGRLFNDIPQVDSLFKKFRKKVEKFITQCWIKSEMSDLPLPENAKEIITRYLVR